MPINLCVEADGNIHILNSLNYTVYNASFKEHLSLRYVFVKVFVETYGNNHMLNSLELHYIMCPSNNIFLH